MNKRKVRLTFTKFGGTGIPMRKRWLYEDDSTRRPAERFFIIKDKKVRICDIKPRYVSSKYYIRKVL